MKHPPLRCALVALVALVTLALATAASGQSTAPDPIVLTGDRLPSLRGEKPQRIVGFAVHGGAWQQIPVQVDERSRVPFARLLGIRRFRSDPVALVYADAKTGTGADPDATFDADDELVFLAADCGGPALADPPAGVVASSRVEIRLASAGDTAGRVYLFASQGKLRPDAGIRRMRYVFELVAGSYAKEYDIRGGPNPERSTVTAPAYRLGFSDRWALDELRLTTPQAPGVDILDRHEVQVIPGSCIRTTKTFGQGGGAIVANVDGPVRAIRSVIGANSGPMTERLWICYPQRFDIVTHLRVHKLPSVFMFFDYSRDAVGMRYADNNNDTCRTVIDGKPDPLRPGRLLWQFVTGPQGSMRIHYHVMSTFAKLVESSLADDNARPEWSQCTGDGHAFGVCGPLLTDLPNTDPRFRDARTLTSTVVVYPGAPNAPRPAGMPAVRPIEVRISR